MSKELTIVYESELWRDLLIKLIEDVDPDADLIRCRCFTVDQWNEREKNTLDHEIPYEKILYIGNGLGDRLKISRIVYDKCSVKISISGNQAAIYRDDEKFTQEDISILYECGEIDKKTARIACGKYSKSLTILPILCPPVILSTILPPIFGFPSPLGDIEKLIQGYGIEVVLVNAVYSLAIKKFFNKKLVDFMDLDSDEWEEKIHCQNTRKYDTIE